MRTVEEIKADISELRAIEEKGNSLCTYDRLIFENLEQELRATLTDGIPLDRLSEICAAEKDGRLVVLPCNVGDTVYVITRVFNGNKIECAIGSRKIDRIGGNALNPVWVVSTQPYELHFLPSEFGKTVFLTRAEAEKALGKEQGHGC